MPTDRSSETAGTDVAAGAARAFEWVLQELRAALNGGAPPDDAAVQLPSRTREVLGRGDRLVAALKLYAGSHELDRRVVEPLPLLCATAHQVRAVIDRRIDVRVEVDADCPPLRVDVNAFEDALLRLMRNARDAMPQGGRLQLRAKSLEGRDGAPAVDVSVCDSGIGMRLEDAARATAPFHTTRRRDPLAGLGLAAVDGFVRASGGTLEIRSLPDRGTTVTLRLPATDRIEPPAGSTRRS